MPYRYCTTNTPRRTKPLRYCVELRLALPLLNLTQRCHAVTLLNLTVPISTVTLLPGDMLISATTLPI